MPKNVVISTSFSFRMRKICSRVQLTALSTSAHLCKKKSIQWKNKENATTLARMLL